MGDNPYIAKIQLGRLLRRYRLRAEMSAGEVTRRMDISEAKLHKLERGANNAVRWQDILGLGVIYKVTSEESEHLLSLAEACGEPGWYHALDVEPDFVTYVEMEGVCTKLWIYEPELINGLFQTADYYKAVQEEWPSADSEKGLALRMKRQEYFERKPAPETVLILNEAALKRVVGSRKIMKAQTERLLELARLPGVSVYVLSFKAGAHQSIGGGYTVMDFDDGTFPKTAYIESRDGCRYEEKTEIVKLYEGIFQQTLSQSTPLEELLT